MNYDAVFLLGFGGPESVDDVRPFVDRVIGNNRLGIPPERYDAVVNRYIAMGGKSPYNRLTQRQAARLRLALRERRVALPVELAFRNAEPYVEDVVARLARGGKKRVLAVIMAPHPGSASSEKYERAVVHAQARLGASAPVVEYAAPFFDDPLFIDAHADRISQAWARLQLAHESATVVFTAHSIPCKFADSTIYVERVLRTASLIADRLNIADWSVAFQSRSGAPSDPWLGPDVRDVLRALPKRGIRAAVVSPIGFLCDHFEVLYDLDVDAAHVARESGVRMVRAKALNTHPAFITMLAERVVHAVAI